MANPPVVGSHIRLRGAYLSHFSGTSMEHSAVLETASGPGVINSADTVVAWWQEALPWRMQVLHYKTEGAKWRGDKPRNGRRGGRRVEVGVK